MITKRKQKKRKWELLFQLYHKNQIKTKGYCDLMVITQKDSIKNNYIKPCTYYTYL